MINTKAVPMMRKGLMSSEQRKSKKFFMVSEERSYSLKPRREATCAAANASAGAIGPIRAKRGSVVCPRT